MKRALLILSSFGYVIFLIAGTDTGLGVYRTPASCFAALACAAVASACVSGRPRWYWGVAGIAALAFSLYGYQQNNEWHERLARARARQQQSAITRPDTNK